MRTEKEIYDLVLNFAFQDERIRIVTLEGSRTNVNIPKDNLQDYDITFFVIDMGEFLKSDDWLSVFGNRIMMQKPEDMELFPPEEKGFSYIMLFDDGVKIDLTLLPVSMLEEYLTRDKLVKIMLDKDNMIKTEIVPTDEDYYIKCPTERKFDDCCNEFWNVAARPTSKAPTAATASACASTRRRTTCWRAARASRSRSAARSSRARRIPSATRSAAWSAKTWSKALPERRFPSSSVGFRN